jgi:heme/copper-type cytochrome/quinol oxidase subunit 3
VVISAYNHASHRTAALPVGKGTIHYSAVENVGLYWQLFDLIWIFLFTLHYLVS